MASTAPTRTERRQVRRAFLDDLKADKVVLYADPTAKQGMELKLLGMPTTILVDRKGRVLQLSIRAKDEEELQSVLDDYQSSTGATTQLGALLKEKFNRE